MDKNNLEWKKIWRLFLLGVALIVFYKTFDNLPEIFSVIGMILSLLTPFIIGIALAFFLYPASAKLESALGKSQKKFLEKRKKGIAVLTVYFVFLAILAVAIWGIIPHLSSAVTELVKKIPGYVESFQGFTKELTKEGGLLHRLELVKVLENINYQSLFQGFLKPDIWGYVEGVTSTLTSIILGLVICLYALLERESLFNVAKRFSSLFMKEDKLEVAGDYVHRISTIFYKFFFGKAIDSLIIGIIALVGFLLLGVPSPAIMALIVGLFNMIPYFGPFLGAIPPVLLALIAGDGYLALWTALFILALQQFDGNLLGPWILGDSVGVSPFWIIFAIVLFGGLFGIWGMLFGVPLVATIQMIARDYFDDGKLNLSVPIGNQDKDEAKAEKKSAEK